MIIRGNHFNPNSSVPPVFNGATVTLNSLGLSVSGNNVASYGYDKIVELGTSVNVTISGTVTPNDETSISNRRIEVDLGARADLAFTGNSFTTTDNGVSEESSYQGKILVDNNGDPTTVASVIRDVKFQLPALYGNIANLNDTPENLYAALSVKMAVQDQDFSLTFPAHASGFHKVIALPDAWGDITSIIKDGQWEQIGSFIKISKPITKSGAWTETYTLYATNLMNAMNEATYEIQF
jgi:hypothetical protein